MLLFLLLIRFPHFKYTFDHHPNNYWPILIECKSPLGIESQHIPDSAITASSELSFWQGPWQSRLNLKPYYSWLTTGWSPSRNDASQWLQVYLGGRKVITGVATQGRGSLSPAKDWVTSYRLSYSVDEKTWTFYKTNGVIKVIIGWNILIFYS